MIALTDCELQRPVVTSQLCVVGPLATDDRERDVVTHAGLRLGGEHHSRAIIYIYIGPSSHVIS